MVQVAGHEVAVVARGVDGRPGSVEHWAVCQCGWDARIDAVLRTNIELVGRNLYLEHLLGELCGLDFS